MLIVCASAILMLTNPVAGNSASTSVGYESLVEGRDEIAIRELTENSRLAEDDPVRLINLGVAYARQGRREEAREKFEAAMRSADRAVLETAEGKWIESRHLARRALTMLDNNELGPARVIVRQASASRP